MLQLGIRLATWFEDTFNTCARKIRTWPGWVQALLAFIGFLLLMPGAFIWIPAIMYFAMGDCPYNTTC